MKRFQRYMILSLAALMAASAQAQDVTYSQAADIAADFFRANGIDAQASTLKRARAKEAPVTEGNSAYYIINNGDAFAIVAGDSRVKPILAYSLENSFDADNVSPGAAWLLEGYEKYILGLEAGTEQLRTPSLPTVVQGKEIETAIWTQNPSPWWDKCPTVDDRQCVAGCVAAAMSIVMRYHCWPATTGYGSRKYTSTTHGITSTANFGTTDYKISTIPTDGRDAYNWTSAQKEAVATLLHHAGVAVNMDYAPTGSGAGDLQALVGMSQYFGYKMGAWAWPGKYASDGDYLQAIIDEIDGNRPVIYSGNSGSGGHMFVCDGYNTDCYLHFNFGWGYYDNGYYSIFETAMEYYQGQTALIGLEPDRAAVHTAPKLAFVFSGDYATLELQGRADRLLQISAANVFNVSGGDISGMKVRYAICSSDGMLKHVMTDAYLASDTSIDEGRYWLNVTGRPYLPSSGYEYTAGDRIYLVYSTDGGTTWEKVHRYDDVDYIDMSLFYESKESALTMTTVYDDCTGLYVRDGYTLNTEGTTFKVGVGYVYNYTVSPFDGTVAVFICDADDTPLQQVGSRTYSLGAGFYNGSKNTDLTVDCQILPEYSLADGYRLVAFCKPTGSSDWKLIDCDDASKYFISIPAELIPDTPVTPTTQTVAFSGMFDTFSSVYDLDFSGISDFAAYTLSMLDMETLVLSRLDNVKSGVGVLLMGANGASDYSADAAILAEAPAEPTDNLLVGVLTDTTVGNEASDTGTNYVFSTSPETGFYLAAGETVTAGHAYMRIPGTATGAPARFVFMSAGQSGIFTVIADTPGDNLIYNLQGIRVTNPVRGLYIINGRKVMIK